MKKLYFLFLLACLVQIHISAQELEPTVYTCGEFYSDIDAIQNSGNNPEDTFVDRFGNTHYKKINTNVSGEQRAIPLTADYVSPGGLFAIYLTTPDISVTQENFTSTSAQGVLYRNVLSQVFADLEVLINETNPGSILGRVNIEVQSLQVNSNMVANAGSYYDNTPTNSIIDGEVAKAIISGSNDPTEWDGILKVNFFQNFDPNFNNSTVDINSFDMYTMLLHEAMHMLGFTSGISEDGTAKIGNYFAYDKLMHNSSNQDLVTLFNGSWSFNSSLNPSVLSTGCPVSNGDIRLTDADLQVFTSQGYLPGTSLSHIKINNDCNFPATDYVMSPSISRGVFNSLNNDELTVLCSINYDINNTYGHANIVQFANPAIITTANNTRLRNFSGCSPVVSGADDYTNMATQPTIQNCSNNVLNILESDLLSNDASDLGLPLAVSGLTTASGTVVSVVSGVAPNRVFGFIPEGLGLVQLNYQPLDTQGNYGNTTYVNVNVTFCPTFGCVSTDTCNLICNPEIEDLNNVLNSCYENNIEDFIPGWRGLFDSINWFADPICLPSTVNNNNLPNAIGGRLRGFGRKTTGLLDNNVSIKSSPISTSVNISPNKRYILSYNKNEGTALNYMNDGPLPSVQNRPNLGVKVVLNSTNILSNTSTFFLQYNHNRVTGNISPANNTQIFDTDKVDIFTDLSYDNYNFSQTVVNFTSPTNDTYDILTFMQPIDQDFLLTGLPYLDPDPVVTNNSYQFHLDRVELIEDRLQDIPQTYNENCGATKTIGLNLCSVANMQYQWWDVTDANPANHVRITDLTDTSGLYDASGILINQSALSYVVSDINANGSEIELSNMLNNTNLQLRRVFPATFGPNNLLVFNNLDNNSSIAPVSIILENSVPTSANFTSTISCETVFFQANNTYETHEWDFDNDGIMDISGSGDDVANTNPSFTFPGLGTFPVTHIVSNACGSITYQENITIDCTTTCTGTSTWDGSSWDNGDPDIDTEVILNGHYDTATYGSFSACSLTVNAGFNLIIDALNYVEVKYSTIIFGDLLVKHTGSFVQIDDSSFFQLQGDGTATIKKITGNSNVNTELSYISSPTTNTTVADLLQNNSLFYGYRYWFNTANFKDSCAETLNNNICVEGTSDGIDDPDPISGYGNDWVYAGNTFVMQPGLGLVVRPNASTSIPLTFTGELNNGVISVPITRNDEDEPLVNSGALNARDDNPIYVGNPYASAISADAFLERNMYNHPGGTNTDGIMDGLILIWSHNTPPSATTNGNQPLNFDFGDYAMINLTGEIEGGEIGLVPNRFIPSGQGIFLDFSNNVISPNGNIIFNNSMRVTGDNNQFFRDSNVPDNKLKLNLSTETGVHGEILLGYVDGATSNFDGSAYDASEHTPIGQNAIIYFNIPDSHKKFVIQGKSPDDLNDQEVVSVGFFNSILESESLEFKININDFQGAFFANHSVYIQDNLLGVCHNLSASDYTFTSAIGEFNDRFDINFSNCETLSVTENEIPGLKVYPNPTNSIINVKASTAIAVLTLYNNLGQVVLEKTEVNHVDVSKMSEGVYFLQIKDVAGRINMVRIIKK